MKPTKTDGLLQALAHAQRSPGWNNRNPAVRCFRVGRCAVYVVPARAWAYRRAERDAQLWQAQA